MMNLEKIPAHMRSGVELYVYDGIPPGSFLTAVLENKLVEAFMHADEINRAAMFAWADFMYNEMPSGSWRSAERVAAWCEARRTSPIDREPARHGFD